jgi:predicted phage terminase large subunit-like protein
VRTSTNKVVFAEHWSPYAEQRRIYVKRAPWNERLFSQADAFPFGRYDDAIDAISGAMQRLPERLAGLTLLDDNYDDALPKLRM